MNIHEVRRYLPHRYPFLLIDRVTDCQPGESLTALKNVSINEPFFPGHFPHHPVMPGVLILEALAQATGILSFRTSGSYPDDDSLYLFVGIDKARFRLQIEPGDQVELRVKFISRKRNMWKFSGEAWVGDKLACSADLMGMIKDMTR